jgi:hypothetical protein
MSKLKTKLSSVTRHQQKAARNNTFRAAIAGIDDGYQEWQIVAAFYAAVHVIQSYILDTTSSVPRDHQARLETMESLPALLSIVDDYKRLKRLSEDCRYTCNFVNTQDVTEALGYLTTISEHINQLFASSRAQPP